MALTPAASPEPEEDATVNPLESSPLSELSDEAAADLLTQKLAALGKEFLE